MDHDTSIIMIGASTVLLAMLIFMGLYLVKLKMALRRKKTEEQEMKRLVSNMENGESNDTNLSVGHENAAAVLQVTSETRDVTTSKAKEEPSGSGLFRRVKPDTKVSFDVGEEKVRFHSLKNQKDLLIGKEVKLFALSFIFK